MSSAEAVALEADRLAARRGDVRLFSGLAFALRAGEALMVTGPNGSGKTTLLRMLAGLTMPDEGEIRWRGEAVRAFDPRLRGVVAFNGDRPALKDELTTEDNLAMWIALGDEPVEVARMTDALEAVALGAQRRLPVRVLSQGQRRRIGLARLKLVRRPLWILDEPLNALDAGGVALLGALLAGHLAEGGVCVAASHLPFPLVAAHQLFLSAFAPTGDGTLRDERVQ